MMHKRLLIVVGLWTLIGLVATSQVQADDNNPDLSTALQTAPQGVSLDNIFQVGTNPANDSKPSSSTVIPVTNPNSGGTDAVVVTTAQNQVGYIWSSGQNSFDLNQDSKSSMWMYFGNRGRSAGDGMAFVLQNDGNHYAARPKFLKDNVFGETVGVWGVDSDNNRTNPADVAKTAIQNSWALEFDTYPGNTSDTFDNAGKGDSFDLATTNQTHLASNYPGDAGSYQDHWKSWGPFGGIRHHYFSLNHEGLLATPNLSNGQWHHLTLDWQAKNHKMTYTFDDKNTDGTVNANPQSRSIVIDPGKFHSNDGKLLWGFTGATGGNFENNLVIFESVQGLVSANASATIYDDSQKKMVNQGDTVSSGDELTYQYHLKYENGKQDWKAVLAKLELPKEVKFKTGKIKYADGSSAEFAVKDAETLKYQLAKNLNSGNRTADIELAGQAISVDQDTKVASAKATFQANNFVTTAATPSFNLQKKAVELALTLKDDHLTVVKGQDVKVTGKLTAKVGDFVNEQIKIQPTLNGNQLPAFDLKASDEKGLVQFTIPATELKNGDNEVTVIASDGHDNQSNMVKLQLRVLSGELKFGKVADNSSFKATKLTGQTQLVWPENDWQLQVIDERGKGANWQLMATATPFKNAAGQTAHGGVIYVDGTTAKPLTNQNVMIQNYQTAADEETYDAAEHWSANRGLRYQVNAGDAVGQYSGKVTWSLVNGPN